MLPNSEKLWKGVLNLKRLRTTRLSTRQGQPQAGDTGYTLHNMFENETHGKWSWVKICWERLKGAGEASHRLAMRTQWVHDKHTKERLEGPSEKAKEGRAVETYVSTVFSHPFREWSSLGSRVQTLQETKQSFSFWKLRTLVQHSLANLAYASLVISDVFKREASICSAPI